MKALCLSKDLPNKPHKWGVKQFALCESGTGLKLRFITYCGKGTINEKDGFTSTESIMLSLLQDYRDKGHVVYTDNFYSSPKLYCELQNMNIGACGTVKAGRQLMPRDIHPDQLHLDKGEDPVFC
jgi:hypothetical protein